MTYNLQSARMSIFIHENILCWQISKAAQSTPGTWARPTQLVINSPRAPNTRPTQRSNPGAIGFLWPKKEKSEDNTGWVSNHCFGNQELLATSTHGFKQLKFLEKNKQQRTPIWSQESVRNHIPSRKMKHWTSADITSKEKWLGLNL